MDEEMRRIKYRQLLNRLYGIRSKFQELNDAFDDLNSYLKENLLVDDKNIVENAFFNINSNINVLKSELESYIIPIVRNKS